MIVLIVSFLVILFLGMPVAYAMGVSAMLSILTTPDMQSLVIGQKMFASMDSFTYLAIPFFMFAGTIMDVTGITRKIVDFAKALLGHITGGLGHATVLTGVLMAGVSGSANADTSAIASIMVPALDREEYDRGFACALVAACGGIGPIIPPSITMVVYAGVTNIAISSLFLSGVIPGLMLGIAYMVIVYFYARKHNLRSGQFAGWKAVGTTFVKAIWAFLMPVIIVGGILTGVVTATEAGCIAVFYGIIYGFLSRNLTLKKLYGCIADAVKGSTNPMAIIAFAGLFGYVLTFNNFSRVVQGQISGLTDSPFIVCLIVVFIIFIAGMFVDPNAICLMLIPVFAPLIPLYGLDPLHFAMVCVLALVMGGNTPPVGLLLYIAAAVTETPLSRVVKNCWWFVAMMLVVILLVIIFPPLATLVPSIL